MTILITGGAGYIGSHTCISLLENGYSLLVLDNLCNANAKVFKRIQQITGQSVTFMQGDVRDKALCTELMQQYAVTGVIHFAALKAVGESSQQPLTYYHNNVGGTLALLEAMDNAGVRQFVFSSSATVYGEDAPVPYLESMPHGRTSHPYGTSKAMIEQILSDLVQADPSWAVSILRYFNPIGAHPSGLIGEDPKGIPNNLLPFITQVAIGKRESLAVFGNDYPTPDGSCIRDYLHVMDLAAGHRLAWQALKAAELQVYNLGTGSGTSVLEMLTAFQQVTGKTVPYHIAPRRAGDLAAFWADASKAERELGWQAKYDLNSMLQDAWRWQSQNPEGY